MTTKETIMQQIDEIVAKNTFGLDALEGIKNLKDNLKEITEERDNYQRLFNQKLNELSEANSELMLQDTRIKSLEERLSAMQKTVELSTKAIYDAEKHKAVADAWQSAMAMVFKPSAVRESVQRNHVVMVPSPNGGGYTQSVTNTDNIIREEI